MNFLKKVVLLFCVVIPVVKSFAQTDAYSIQKITSSAQRSDFRLMRDTLEKIHPGIYRYRTKAAMDRLFDSCYVSIRDSMTVPQFYMVCSFMIAAMEDGHSNVRIPRPVMNVFMEHEKIFPAMTMFIHERMYIYCCNQDTSLAGAELLSINNHPARDVVQKLFTYIQSDAGIASHKNWEINESFPFLYRIQYGKSDRYTITYRNKNGAVKTTVLKADLFQHFKCPPPFQRPARYLKLGYQPGGIALLTIQTFFDGLLQQTGENFNRFLDSAFTDMQIKKPKKLLIDIRGNQGGNDGNGALLYSYLTQKPFMYYASQETVTEKFRTDADHPNLLLQQPKAHSYEGKIFILANGRSFSASSEFSAIVRSEKRGLFIGEEVGGGYFGNTSGNEANVMLPNSQLICRIPMIKYTSAVKKTSNKGNGIKPDFPVNPSIMDFIYHRDSQLEKALSIAAKN